MDGFVELPHGAGRIFCRDSGLGPPILFVHGFLADGTAFTPVTTALRRDYRCLAVDLRSHGLSDCARAPYTMADQGRDLQGLLDERQIERVHVVGHSMGGMAALQLTLREPTRIATLTLVATSGREAPRWKQLHYGLVQRMLGWSAVRSLLVRWAELQLFSPQFRRQRPEVVSAFLAQTNGFSAAALRHAMAALANRENVLPQLTAVRCPTLVVAAADDRAMALAEAELLAAALPRARSVILAETGHLIPLERPARLSGLVAELVAEA